MSRKSPSKNQPKSRSTRIGTQPTQAYDDEPIGTSNASNDSASILTSTVNILPTNDLRASTPPRNTLGVTPSLGIVSTLGMTPSLRAEEPWSPTRQGLRSPSKPLPNQLQQEKYQADGDLWDARVENEELQRKIQAQQDHNSRVSSDIAKLQNEKESYIQQIESLESHQYDLLSQLKRQRDQTLADKKSSLEKLERRDEFIESLQLQLDELKNRFNVHNQLSNSGKNERILSSEHLKDQSSASIDFDSTTDRITANSTITQTPASTEILELSRELQKTKQVRKQLHHFRQENFKLRQRLAEINGTEVPEWEESDGSEHTFTGNSTAEYTQAGISQPEFNASNDVEGFALSDEFITVDQVERDAATLGYKLVPFTEHSVLERNDIHKDLNDKETPVEKHRAVFSVEELGSAAAALNMTLINKSQYAELNSELFDHKFPNKDKVTEIAERAGFRVVPENPTMDEVRKVCGPELVVVDKNELNALENPGPSTLRRFAMQHGLAILPQAELEQFEKARKPSNEPESSSHESITIAELRKQADLKNLVILSADDYQSIITKHTHQEFTALPMQQRTKFYEDIAKSQNTSPRGSSQRNSPVTSGHMEERIQRLGLVSITKEEYQKLKDSARYYEPTKSDVIQSAKYFGLATLPMEEFSKLRATKWNSPTRVPTKNAKSSGLQSPSSSSPLNSRSSSPVHDEFKVLPKSYFVDLQRLAEAPTRADVEALGRKIGVLVFGNHSELRSKARELGLREPLSDEQVLSRARELGWAPKMSDSDIIDRARQLGLVDPMCPGQIKLSALKLGLIEPPSDEEIKEKSLKLGLILPLQDSDIILKAKSLGLSEPLSDNEIRDRGLKLGLMKPMTDAEILGNAKKLGLVDPPSEGQIKEAAKTFGLIEPLSPDDIKIQGLSLGLIEPLSESQIKSKAKSLGLIEPFTEDQLVAKAAEVGLTKPPTDAEILLKAKTLGLSEPLTTPQILSLAKENGLIEPLSEDNIKLKAKKIGMIDNTDSDKIKSKAKSLGLAEPVGNDEIISRAMSMGFRKLPTDNEIRTLANKLGLVEKLSDKQVKAKAMELGLMEKSDKAQIISFAKKFGLRDPPQENEIKRLALAQGLVEPLKNTEIKQKAKQLGLIEPLSSEQIKVQAKSLGLVDPLTKSQIVSQAESIGLVQPLSDAQIIKKAKSLGLQEPYDDEDIKRRAISLGFSKKASDTEILAEGQKLGLAYPLSNEEIKIKAKTLGLSEPNQHPLSDEPKKTSMKPNDSAAAALGHRRISAKNTAHRNGLADGNKIDGNNSTKNNLEDTINHEKADSDSILGSQATQSEFSPHDDIPVANSLASKNDEVEVAGVTSESDDTLHLHNYPGSSPSRRRRRHFDRSNKPIPLSSGALHKSQSGLRMQRSSTSDSLHQRLGSISSSISAQSDIDTDLVHPKESAVGSFANKTHLHSSRRLNTGLSAAPSNYSLATLLESDPQKLLQQLIIGEVLYKYHGGINFEGLTGGRHKRYFWFRPERRTMYWHAENPQFFNNFTPSPKSLLVSSVEEVIDRNPLPTALFHRSIIVKGKDRTIKITCPTQARHQTWITSLKYTLREDN